MPDLTGQSLATKLPEVFNSYNVGTAAGTTTILSEPCVLGAINVTQRVASGQSIIYDSIGTSGTVIGTITLGTQTFSDPPSTYTFNIRTKNALTITNSANLGLIVSAGK